MMYPNNKWNNKYKLYTLLAIRWGATTYGYFYPEEKGMAVTNPDYLRHVRRQVWEDLLGLDFEFHKTGWSKKKLNQESRVFDIIEKAHGLEGLIFQGSSKLTKLPRNVYERKIKHLVIRRCNQLNHLDEALRKLPHLNSVSIIFPETSKKELNIGTDLTNLKKLVKLEIEAHSIKDLGGLKLPTSLEFLSIRTKDNTALPECIGNLKKLQVLKLSGLQNITSFPNLSTLEKLKYLKIDGGEKLEGLPNGIDQLKTLEILEIANLASQHESIDGAEKLIRFPMLKRAFLFNIPFREIKGTWSGMTDLTNLVLQKIKLTEFPQGLTELSRLELLNIDLPDIKELPESIGNLKTLELLSVQGRCLEKVSTDFSKLKVLKKLELIHLGQTKKLPESIQYIPQVKELYMRGDSLEALPEFGEEMKELRSLKIYGNEKIKSLPITWKDCPNLAKINLLYIGIEKLPEQYIEAKHLQDIHCSDCPNLETAPSVYGRKKKPINIIFKNCGSESNSFQIGGWRKRLLITYGNFSARVQLMYYLVLGNHDVEPFTAEFKIAFLELFREKDKLVRSILAENIHLVNHNNVTFGQAKVEEGNQVFIIGKLSGTKTEAKNKLKGIGLSTGKKLTDETRFILVGNGAEIPYPWKDKAFIYFTEKELEEKSAEINPGFLQEQEVPEDFVQNIRELIWSNDPKNESVALEIVRSGGLVEDIIQDMLVVAKTSSDKKVRAQYRRFLKGKISSDHEAILSNPGRLNIGKYSPYSSYPHERMNIGSFIYTHYKRSGRFKLHFLQYDDGSHPYRKQMIDELKSDWMAKSHYVRLPALTEKEFEELLSQDFFKGKLKRLVFSSNAMNRFPIETILKHKESINQIEIEGNGFDETTLPDAFFELYKLIHIKMTYKNLETISEKILSLKRLQELYIYSNHKVKFPKCAENMPKRKRFYSSSGWELY